jgi:hypothetical protein
MIHPHIGPCMFSSRNTSYAYHPKTSEIIRKPVTKLLHATLLVKLVPVSLCRAHH